MCSWYNNLVKEKKTFTKIHRLGNFSSPVPSLEMSGGLRHKFEALTNQRARNRKPIVLSQHHRTAFVRVNSRTRSLVFDVND